ncbi:GNAT family N-acetyltransferase [Acidovorax sp. sic0104]|uniref:GNAT family N-acetyltransferase n=1 Tax=Acidovorax sp. sic0104 TaxID=2854784 RepID=UPI001C465FCE|nr:GNAT family N-acetyltransferase [Acidovorax sp. sic0104]MBV7543060.1 GNAT family N-acetyltransferase [Acidovorax sp. sic0104]
MNTVHRFAVKADLPLIIDMLADDVIALLRETPEEERRDVYLHAWEDMQKDQFNKLLVAEVDGELVGVLQLTYISGLSRSGMKRAQIEGIRVERGRRGHGIGRDLVGAAIGLAKAQGCGLVQLTTDKRRRRANDFYEALGFAPTHEGMKLVFD